MVLINPALALEYEFEDAGAGSFGKPTSTESVTVISTESPNVDVSKNSAYIPPAFGSPSADTRGTGEQLTPNLAGTPPMQIGGSNAGANGNTGGEAIMPPASQPSTPAAPSIGFTPVTGMKYADGSIGSLKIPAIGVNVKVYDGETLANMKKGAGHFSSTSVWDGNVAMAAHNRGTNSYFGKIHTLENGDKITYSTKLGTRTYQVYSVFRISETDSSCLNPTSDNILTLTTCVRDVPELRWCVRAKQI